MIAVDSSVAVAALLPWHHHHSSAVGLIGDAVLPTHAAFETYSVLTRLPAPLAPQQARELVDQFRLALVDDELQRHAVSRFSDLGIRGGAIYDALIAMTAKSHSLELVSRDRRAERVYELVGVQVSWL